MIPELGRSPEGGNGNLLQNSWLGNPINRGSWQATVHGVAKSQTRLSEHAASYSEKKYTTVVKHFMGNKVLSQTHYLHFVDTIVHVLFSA